MRLIHLSDLHFGDPETPMVRQLVRSVNALDPDVVIVTGDLTRAGRPREFAAFERFAAELEPELLMVPGNHDVPAYQLVERFLWPWRRFRRLPGSLVDQAVTRAVDGHRCGLALLGLNSARRWRLHWNWSLGVVSSRQCRLLAGLPAAASLRVCVLHHPVIERRQVAGAAVRGAAALRDALYQAQIDLVLCGHAHRPRQDLHAAAPGTLFVQAGAALGERLRGDCASFNVVDLDRSRVRITVFEWTGAVYSAGSVNAGFVRTDGRWHRSAAAAQSSDQTSISPP